MNVTQLQCLLAFLGHYRAGVDGLDGPKTRQAVADFQRWAGLSPTGAADGQTQTALCQAVGRWTPQDERFWADIRHFRRSEFACKCGACGGYPAEPAEALVRLADQVRDRFGAPATVTSGVRCQSHNARVGGVASSRHLTGKAMDFRVQGIPSGELLACVRSLAGVRYAYAIDENHVHMDVN